MIHIIRKLFSFLLCLCLLPGIAVSEEDADTSSILLKIWNCSGLEISYLRFDIYRGNEPAAIVVSCPIDGEDFYRCPYTPESQKELDKLRIDYSYGISDLSPEEAVLQMMMGNPAEEHQLPAPELTLQCGETYNIILVRDQDSYILKRTAEGRNSPEDASDLQDTYPGNPKDVITKFLHHWSMDEYDDMLEMCTAEWKAGTKDPEGALLAILDDRRPYTCKSETVSGSDGDEIRTVTVKMDIRKTDKAKEHDYLFHIIVQKDENGIWRIDPGSLHDFVITDSE